MADEHLHLEDILGGVEEEIQRAEARLKKDLLQWSSASPRKEVRDPFSRTKYDETSRIEGLQGRFRRPRCDERQGVVASDTLDQRSETTRRRASAELCGFPLASGAPNINGSGYSSPRRRTALVNRLLQDRDIRLQTSGNSGAVHEEAGQVDGDSRSFEYWETIDRGQGGVDSGRRDAALEVGNGPRPSVDGSPENSAKIFFASDILDDINGADKRVEDAGSLNLRDLVTGVFEHKIGAREGGRSIPGEEGVDSAGEAGYLDLEDEGVQQTQYFEFSKPGGSDSNSLRDPGDGCRAVVADRCGPGDPYVSSWDEKMHYSAEKERYRGREEAALVESEEDKACEPNNNKRYSSRGGQQQTRERRLEELSRNRQQIYSDRERQRREMQEQEVIKECTFRPKVTASAAMVGKAWDDADGFERPRIPLHERLHKDAREREAIRALAQHHLEAEILRECTFQPAVNAANGTNSTCQRPLHQRVREVERQREHKLRILHADKEEREGATFAPPPLGRVSERLARETRPAWAAGAGVATSSWGWLTTGSQIKTRRANERRQLRLREYEEAQARMNTFEPSISQGTERLVGRRPELQAPFDERRAMMEARKLERAQLRLAARAEEETRWFNPVTAKLTDSLLRRCMPQRLQETAEKRVARMASTTDQRRREQVDRQKAKEQSECTFQPNLNLMTQSIGRAAPLDELVNNRRGQRVRERAQEKARNADLCTHKPILLAEQALSRDNHQQKVVAMVELHKDMSGDKAYERARVKRVDSHRRCKGREAAVTLYGPGNKYRLNVLEPARMTAELRAREREHGEQVRALREEREMAEMQPCTFVPRTNESIIRAHGPVVVRGLGRHMQLKDVAQQQEADRRMREAQAFGVRPGAVRRTTLGETLVEPFSLSEGTGKEWWEERRRRHEAERAAQCTFKPWTVESERGQATSRLLEWSSMLSSAGGSEGSGASNSMGCVLGAPVRNFLDS